MRLDVPQPPIVSLPESPRPFSEIPPLWLKLPQMTERFFSAEMSHTSPLNTFLGIMIYAVVATFAGTSVQLVRGLAGSSQASSTIQTLGLLIGCSTILIVPVGFYLNTGLNYVGALIFGGNGKFSDQAYLASVFFVPMGFISSLVSFLALIPTVGPIIEWPIFFIVVVVTTIYQYRNVKAVHGIASGRAVGAVLAPFSLILCICLPVLVIVVLAALGPVIGNTFSTINRSLLMPVP